MSLKKSLMDYFAEKYDVKDISAALDKYFIVALQGREWLVEIDCDGANAVTVSPIEDMECSYPESHQIVVLQSADNNSESNVQRYNGKAVEEAIFTLSDKLFQCDKELL